MLTGMIISLQIPAGHTIAIFGIFSVAASTGQSKSPSVPLLKGDLMPLANLRINSKQKR
jgi:hypothetical protein